MHEFASDAKEIFGEAIEIESHSERESWLDQACGQNTELRSEVEQLLAAFQHSDGFMRQPALAASTATAASDSAKPLFPPRFEAVSELARGGMGAVWRVVDRQFDRPLAVKVTLPNTAADSAALARFDREAQLTGSLQHPGIPPVADRGVLGDGTPFFSMKLVEGQTLAQLLAQRSETKDDLPRFLGIFEQICQAVGYAHSRGVIHRDLKPANVMVGEFGEVQVMDWGMAKPAPGTDSVLPADVDTTAVTAGGSQIQQRTNDLAANTTVDFTPANHVTDETVVSDASSDSANDESLLIVDSGAARDLTRAGQVMGTLAYMAPEQARGELDNLDAPTDVFALGGILCKILTGNAPYTGDTQNQLYQSASEARLNDAHKALDACTADVELIALCKECLAPDMNDRPKDGDAVANRIRDYQQSVRQRLEQERSDRVAAEVRIVEERKRRRVFTGLIATVSLLVVGIGAASWWYRSEVAAAVADIEDALARAAELQENHRFAAAETVLKQAEGRLSTARNPVELSQRVQVAITDLEMVRKLDTIRLRMATDWTGGELMDVESSIGRNGDYAQAFQEYGIELFNGDSPSDLGQRITARKTSRFLIAAIDDWAVIDPQNRSRILAIASAADPDPFGKRLRDPAVWGNRRKMVELSLEKKVISLPPATLHFFATSLHSVGEEFAAAELLKRATIQHPTNFWLHFTAGYVLNSIAIRKPRQAVGYYRTATAIRPTNAAVYSNLGLALVRSERPIEAEMALTKACRLDPDFAPAHSNLGVVLMTLNRLDEAEKAFRRAIAVDAQFAPAHTNLGIVLEKTKRFKDAESAYRRAVEVRPQQLIPRLNLGVFLAKADRKAEATPVFRQAIAQNPHLISAYSTFASPRRSDEDEARATSVLLRVMRNDVVDASLHYNLGVTLVLMNQNKAAMGAFRQAIAVDPSMVAAHYNLGKSLQQLNRLQEAEASYLQSIKLDPECAPPHVNIGLVYKNTRRIADAEASFRRAIAIDPNLADAYHNLGKLLKNKGELKEAEDALRKTISLKPAITILAPAYYDLGGLLQQTGRPKKAESAFRQAIAVDAQYVMAYVKLGFLINEFGRRKDAIRILRKAIEVDDKCAEANFILGYLLGLEGERIEESLRYLKRGHTLGSRRRNWRYPSSRLISIAERLLTLDRKLDAFREEGQLKLQSSEAAVNLAEFAFVQKKQPRIAVELFRIGLEKTGLAPQLRFRHEYNAACAALLSAAGKVEHGADRPKAADAARLRRQALVWLNSNLALLKRTIRGKLSPAQIKYLRHWQTDPDLATVRGDAVDALPEEERAGWRKLWTDLAELIDAKPVVAARPRSSGR